MLKNTRFWILISLIAFGLPALVAACGDLGEEDCTAGETNDEGQTCVCSDDDGAACTLDDEDEDSTCSCEFVGGTTGGTTTGTTPVGPAPYRFVMIEDSTPVVAGDSPGADIDSVEVVKADGSRLAATTVEDAVLGGGTFLNPNDILGLPDSNCEVKNFVALGGKDAGGYIIVGFADTGVDGTFKAGDSIVVSELGGTMCGKFDDDPFSVSVSVSKDQSTFIEIASDVTGNNPITVP